MKQAGCNMSNRESYIRATFALLLGCFFTVAQLWYLLIIPIILFYTAYQKYCLMFTLFGINKKLSIENYYHALLPKYSPYASCIFNNQSELLYMNHSAKKKFYNFHHASEFNIVDAASYIDLNHKKDTLFKYDKRTYQLRIQGIKEEQILLVYINDITDILKLQSTNMHLTDKVEDILNDNEQKNHLIVQQSKFVTLGELVENITHQWKQPLSTLSAVLSHIQCAPSLDKKEMNDKMRQASALIQIMSQTVDDFKNFFKLDKKPELFSINKCMKNVMLILSSSLTKEGIKVINSVNPTIQVTGYKNEFTQVLLNILSNAKDAFEENKPDLRNITIETFFDEDKVRLVIVDTAGGIPSQHLPKIFNSHYTTKGNREGTGIGLHMSKIIIEKDMHGSIEADNYQQGARFSIELPAQIAI